MIKNLLDADDEMPKSSPPEKQITFQENDVNPLTNETLVHDDQDIITQKNPPREVFEIPEGAKFFTTIPDISEKAETQSSNSDALFEQTETPPTKNILAETIELENPPIQEPNAENLSAEVVRNQTAHEKSVKAAETLKSEETPEIQAEKPLFQTNFTPETPDETVRKSGMAYSAAIVLIGSIVFMMLLGWFADLLLGIKPVGIVGGIILGAIIGFIQFFRITSSIHK